MMKHVKTVLAQSRNLPSRTVSLLLHVQPIQVEYWVCNQLQNRI